MTTPLDHPTDRPTGPVRRLLASPPARVLMLGFALLLMMDLNGDLLPELYIGNDLGHKIYSYYERVGAQPYQQCA